MIDHDENDEDGYDDHLRKEKSDDGDNDLRQHRMEAEGSSYSQ